MSAPQTPSPCPVKWCQSDHHRYSTHLGPRFGTTPAEATIVQGVASEEPEILFGAAEAVFLTAEEARSLAAIIAAAHQKSPLAAALRQAADELDRITSGGAT